MTRYEIEHEKVMRSEIRSLLSKCNLSNNAKQVLEDDAIEISRIISKSPELKYKKNTKKATICSVMACDKRYCVIPYKILKNGHIYMNEITVARKVTGIQKVKQQAERFDKLVDYGIINGVISKKEKRFVYIYLSELKKKQSPILYKKDNTLVASLIYIVNRFCSEKTLVTQKEIADLYGISGVTLRNNCKDIVDALSESDVL